MKSQLNSGHQTNKRTSSNLEYPPKNNQKKFATGLLHTPNYETNELPKPNKESKRKIQ